MYVCALTDPFECVQPIIEYLNSNITLLKWMIAEGYGDARTIGRRVAKMEAWLQNPNLLQADEGASYAAELHIDLNDIKAFKSSYIHI